MNAQARWSEAEPASLAEELERADHALEVLVPISRRFPEATIEDGYAVQRAWRDLRVRKGRAIAGRKVGLTSIAGRATFSAPEPVHGVVWEDSVLSSGAVLARSGSRPVRVEVELGIVMGSSLAGGDCSVDQVREASAYVVPAFEIVATHFGQAKRTVVDLVAENVAYEAVVRNPEQFAMEEIDLAGVEAVLRRSEGEDVVGRVGDGSDHPLSSIAWLVRALSRSGEGLMRGDLVMSGSLVQPVPLSPGEAMTCEFAGLGAVSVSMES